MTRDNPITLILKSARITPAGLILSLFVDFIGRAVASGDSDQSLAAIHQVMVDVQNTTKEISNILIDGFTGQDVVVGQLERAVDRVGSRLDGLEDVRGQIEALLSTTDSGLGEWVRTAIDMAIESLGELEQAARELGLSADFRGVTHGLEALKDIPLDTGDVADRPHAMDAHIANLETQLDHLSNQLEARRAEIAAEQVESTAVTPMTPEELQAAYAPSPEMQARIDAVTESFGRLAGPLLPELEARIESLCVVLDECAAHCSSGPCAEGQAEEMGITFGAAEVAQPGIVPLATGEADPSVQEKSAKTVAYVASKGTEMADKVGQELDQNVTPQLDAFANKISDVFVQASRDGKISADEIGGAFKQMAMRILQEQVFSKIFSQMGPFGQIAGNLLGGLFGFAGGGAVNPHMPVLVGERGPELLVPRAPGRVVNAADSRRMMGGRPPVNITQNIKIEPTTKNDLFAMIQASRPVFREDAKRAVFDALNHIRY